jgi:hypothetical protein
MYAFNQKLKAATTPEEKKAINTDRMAMFTQLRTKFSSAEEKKILAQKAKAIYTKACERSPDLHPDSILTPLTLPSPDPRLTLLTSAEPSLRFPRAISSASMCPHRPQRDCVTAPRIALCQEPHICFTDAHADATYCTPDKANTDAACTNTYMKKLYGPKVARRLQAPE